MPESAGDTSGDTLLFWFREALYAEETERSQRRLGAGARKRYLVDSFSRGRRPQAREGWHIRNGKAAINPARLVRQRAENNGRIRFLTDEEEKNLREAIRDRFPEHEAELTISLGTGMRLAEETTDDKPTYHYRSLPTWWNQRLFPACFLS